MRSLGRITLVVAAVLLSLMWALPASAVTPTISVSDAWIVEGNAGTSTGVFTVSLSEAPAAGGQVTVQASTANRDATAGSDYVALGPTTLTFAPGETSKPVSVTVIGDTAHENNEDFELRLSNPVGGVFGDRTGEGTIADEEGPFVFTQSDAAVVEGNAGNTDAMFTVWISSPPGAGEQASVNVQTMNGTATAGSDYVTVPPTTLTFGPGETSKQVPVPVIGDTTNEANETIITHLSGETRNGNVADSEGTGTIVDDDPLDTAGPTRWVYATNAWVMEGNTGTTNAVFTIYLSSPPGPGQQVTVQARTEDEGATAGSDYAAVTTSVVFGPGEISKQVIVPVNGDLTGENFEQFLLNISLPTGAPATIADKRGRGTINDEEGPAAGPGPSPTTTTTPPPSTTSPPPTTTTTPPPSTTSPPPTTTTTASPTPTTPPVPPTISVSDAWVVEGNVGTSNATFVVSLSAAPGTGEQVTVQARTLDRDATAGSDYVALGPTTLTFGAGEASKQVSVTVIGDTLHENNEGFDLELSSPVGGAFGDRTGSGIIADEEGPFFFTQSDAAVVEGNAGTTDAMFTVWISSAPEAGEQASVNVQTMNVTATAGSDYVTVPVTTLAFGPGETSKQVPVSVIGETVNEANETFVTHLNGETRNANVADSEGTGTIVDDDPLDTAGPTRWVYATNAWVMEGNTGTTNAVFTIYLSSPPGPGQQVTVNARTQNVSATAGSDYTAVTTSLVFGPGEISKQVIVPVNGDLTGESLEEFLLDIVVARNAPAIVADKRGRGFINGEEGPI